MKWEVLKGADCGLDREEEAQEGIYRGRDSIGWLGGGIRR